MRKILSIFISLLVGISLFAQPRLTTKEYYLGVHGGIMASWVNFSPAVSQKALSPALGATGGLIFRYAGHKCCGLQLELNYMQRGWQESQTKYCRQLDYVDFSMLSHITFGNRFRGFFNLGPQIGYCVRDNVLHEAELETSAHQYAQIDTPFDWGLAAGIGILYRSKKAGVVQLEARFNYSFGDLYANHASDFFRMSNSMNASVNLAYLWEFKRKCQ